uniref:Uncharacterized protein n=1 Tax=Anopheles stephensi TaxID=30069 RepID=A0A182YJT2_ANOST
MSLRKHKCFSQCDKLKIIEAHEAGKSRNEVMHEFGLPLSSYYKIISQRDATKQQCLQGKGYVRRNRSSDYPNLERCMIHWINQSFGAECHPLEGPVIKAQAKLFSIKLGIEEFSASNGWLDGFKKRHGLTFNRSPHGLASNVDGRHGTAEWSDCFANLLDEYEANDIYSIAVSGLFYQCLPEQIFKYQANECHDGEVEQERVTVLLCANITGTEKLPILVIGRSKCPELFGRFYATNAKAWITGAMFVAWLTELNDRMVSNERHIVLLINHFHVPAIFPTFTNVKIVVLPSKSTSDSVKPQHNELIHSFKSNFRTEVVKHLLDCGKKRTKPNVSLPFALNAAARAWRKVDSDTVVNHFMQTGCWPYALCGSSSSQQEKKDTNIRPSKSDWDKVTAHEEPKPSFSDYVRVDENVAVTGTFTNDEIVEMATYQAKADKATATVLDAQEFLDVKKTVWSGGRMTTRTSIIDRNGRKRNGNEDETVIDQRVPIIHKRDALKALETVQQFFRHHTYQDAATFGMLYELEKRIQAIEV